VVFAMDTGQKFTVLSGFSCGGVAKSCLVRNSLRPNSNAGISLTKKIKFLKFTLVSHLFLGINGLQGNLMSFWRAA
jgi:hypothetical protein